MPVQELTNEQKAQLLLQGCLYKEQGDETTFRVKETPNGHYVEQVHTLFGIWKDCKVELPIQDTLSIRVYGHNRKFAAEIPLESIEIIK